MKKFSFVAAVILLCALVVLNGCAGIEQQGDTQEVSESTASEAQDTALQNETAQASQLEDGEAALSLIEPEQLISQQEAETLLGVPVEAKKTENSVVGQKLCFYSEAGNDAGVFLQICITQQAFMPEGSPNTPESIYNTTKEMFGGDSCVVEGPGDETILVTGGYYILCDGYMLQISAGNMDDSETIALLDAASETAVDNLKALTGSAG